MTRGTWTPVMVNHHLCFECGLELVRHGIVDRRCPHTADSLTDEQVIDLWRMVAFRQQLCSGVTFADCLDASIVIRGRANEIGLYYPTPPKIDEQRAREKIAMILNTMEPT